MCVCVCVSVCVCVCARVRVCVYALRIVSRDKIVRFKNTSVILLLNVRICPFPAIAASAKTVS